jgi:hypothetical protein
MFILLTL